MTQRAQTIIHHIGLLWTMAGAHADDTIARCGRDAMREVDAHTEAAIAIGEDGRILGLGSEREVLAMADEHTVLVDAQGGFVCPGLVDPHTHLVHGGSREQELPMRLAGAGYLDILRAGGGILSTVRETARRSEDDLLAQAAQSVRRMLSFGVTTLEAKTGYGMTQEVEQKQLQVALRLAGESPVGFVHTALPAHAVLPERLGDRDRFIEEIASMWPALYAQGAEFADAFVEEGVFSVDEGRYLLSRAQAAGLKVKLHADEMVAGGGAQLAAELGAVSADHLLAATDEGLAAMAKAGVVAVCLPGTSFYLQKTPARARHMLDEAGLAVAIASDYNPGSSPSENFGLTMSLALLTLRMSPEEVFMAATRNAACAIDRGDRAGVLAPGRSADLVLFGPREPAYILTHYGINHVAQVFIAGRRVA